MKEPALDVRDLRERLGETRAGGRKPIAAKDAPKAIRADLESPFRHRWEALFPALPLESQFRFHETRQWRADFAHLESKTLIEIEGGTWSGGGHTRGSGFERDARKHNAAAAAGYVVFRLTSQMAGDPEQLNLIARTIEERGRELAPKESEGLL